MSLAALLRCAQSRQQSFCSLGRLCNPNSGAFDTSQTFLRDSCCQQQQDYYRYLSTSTEQGQQFFRCMRCHTRSPVSVRAAGNKCAAMVAVSKPASVQALPQFNPVSHSTNPAEIRKFAELASEWWNPQGPFTPLHAMNPVRCKFLRQALCQCLK